MPVYEATNMSTIGACLAIFLSILIVTLPRRLVFLPILIAVCCLTYGQVVVLFNLNFTVIRILLAVGWARLIIRNEIEKLFKTPIDKALICYLICNYLLFNLREQSAEALINRLGFIYNGFGSYFLFRASIRDNRDIEKVIELLVMISIPLAIALLVEKFTGQNLFSIFGGVPELSWVRDETIRAQGPFAHAILAGTFGAVLMPLFIGLWFDGKTKKSTSIAGMVAATIIVWSSHSSVSLFSFLCGLSGMAMWRLRDNMRTVRRVSLLAVIFLHMIMKAPVWYLISRAGEIAGGTGYHRARLIDQAIFYIDDWWLLGTSYTAHWMPYGLVARPNHTDITNQFILEGIDGGILTMILFITIIVFCYKSIGNTIKQMGEGFIGNKIMFWSMGASLFVMLASFIGVTYYDQMIMVWYLLLAMIASIKTSE